jgi:hypothetical protein
VNFEPCFIALFYIVIYIIVIILLLWHINIVQLKTGWKNVYTYGFSTSTKKNCQMSMNFFWIIKKQLRNGPNIAQNEIFSLISFNIHYLNINLLIFCIYYRKIIEFKSLSKVQWRCCTVFMRIYRCISTRQVTKLWALQIIASFYEEVCLNKFWSSQILLWTS